MTEASEPPEFEQPWNAKVADGVPAHKVAETTQAGFIALMGVTRRLTREELVQPFSDGQRWPIPRKSGGRCAAS